MWKKDKRKEKERMRKSCNSSETGYSLFQILKVNKKKKKKKNGRERGNAHLGSDGLLDCVLGSGGEVLARNSSLQKRRKKKRRKKANELTLGKSSIKHKIDFSKKKNIYYL
jgi:hypothetical protein